MDNRPLIASLFTLTAAVSCVKGPAFLTQGGASEASIHRVAVATVEQAGAVTGALSKDTKSTQILAASANSEVAGSTIEFPPGSVALNTEVTIQVGANLASAALFGQLNINSEVAQAGKSVSFSSSQPFDAVVPFTVAIPLPDSSSLALDDPYANLVIIYHINKAFANNADYSGIIGRDAIDTSSGFARFAVNHFGTYQAMITKTLVKAVEVATAALPPVKQAPPVPAVASRFYFTRGPLPVSFQNNGAQSGLGFQGWVNAFGPAKTGGQATLTTGRISKAAAN